MIIDKLKKFFSLNKKSSELPEEIFDSAFSATIATTEVELAQAYALLHDRYVELKLVEPTATQLLYGFHSFLPQTSIVIVKYNSIVVGAASMTADSLFGLPSDARFRANNNALRRHKALLAEVSELALSGELISHGGAIKLLLRKYILIYNQRFLKADLLFSASDAWNEFLVPAELVPFVETVDNRFTYPTSLYPRLTAPLLERFCDINTWDKFTDEQQEAILKIYSAQFGEESVAKFANRSVSDSRSLHLES